MSGVIIEDSVVEPKVPKAKRIQIGDVAEGEATPSIRNDRLQWHCCIRPRGHSAILHWLIQGHGPSVVEAIGEAIVHERKEIRAKAAILAQIEQVCATANFTDEELVRRLHI